MCQCEQSRGCALSAISAAVTSFALMLLSRMRALSPQTSSSDADQRCEIGPDVASV